LKFSVKPKRAAVFLDDQFMGPAGDFGGSMKVPPGRHSVKIELLGYRTYQTTVDAIEGKKAKVEVDLPKGSGRDAGPLVRAQARGKGKICPQAAPAPSGPLDDACNPR
jgi:hypothetical protein